MSICPVKANEVLLENLMIWWWLWHQSKTPCGLCYSNWGHVPPFPNNICVFLLPFSLGCYKSKVFEADPYELSKLTWDLNKTYAIYSFKRFWFSFLLVIFFCFGFQITKEFEVSKGLTVNISTMRCITV